MSNSDDVNLTDYILERVYGKSDSFNRDEINSLLESISNKDLWEIVQVLPSDEINPNKVYLVYNNSGEDNNLFDVFLYINNNWEQLDSLSFNISDYYTAIQLDGLLSAKASNSELQATKNNIQTIQTKLNTVHNALTDFNEVLIDFNDGSQQSIDDLTTLKNNSQDLIDAIEDINTEINTIKTNITNAQQSITGLDHTVNGDTTTNPQTKGLTTELTETKQTLTGTITLLQTAQNNIISLQSSNQALNTRVTALENSSSGGGITNFDEEFEASITRLISEANQQQ